MDERQIKLEYNVNLHCRACLSVGRILIPLAEYSNVFKTLTSHCELMNKPSETEEVCWECYALLRRVSEFQKNVQKANELLQIGQAYLHGSLSTLSTVTLNDSAHTIYVNEKNMQTDVKADITDSNDDPDHAEDFSTQIDIKKELDKDTKKNRWAEERAIQNKKPKFKMVTNCENVFRKVKLSNEELYRYMEAVKSSDYYKSKRYKCENCLSLFKDEKLLAKHIRMYHKGTKHYKCDICESNFRDKRHLSSHILKHYCVYECTLCSYRCKSRKERTRHFKNLHRKVFQCVKCTLKFCSRREFFKHFKEWHENFVCDYCGISFKMRYCIIDHIRKQHSTFECKDCNKRFARYNGLWLHNKLVHAPPGQTAYCVECDKKYVDIYRYRWHLANSARHKPRKRVRIPCPSCDKVFSKNIYMKDHYNLVHLKYYKYRCEECDKNFIRNADLVKHRRRVHEGILPPKNKICDMCGRGFTTNKILTNHMRTHTGERPFVCTTCPARFAQHTALASHVRAVHDKRDR